MLWGVFCWAYFSWCSGFLSCLFSPCGGGRLFFWGGSCVGLRAFFGLIAGRPCPVFDGFCSFFCGFAGFVWLFESALLFRCLWRASFVFVGGLAGFMGARHGRFLVFVEYGALAFLGAWSGCPWFDLTAGVFSRARVLTLKRHDENSLSLLLTKAEALIGRPLPVDEDGRVAIIAMADGDGRAVLTLAEELYRSTLPDERIGVDGLRKILQRRAPLYDKGQDGHYNLISALHKSVRGSDPDAALYYLARMLDAGEDPLYLGRRLVRMASEDIGLADPQALQITLAAKDAFDYLGSPEGELALAQACVYLASAPKSNAVYKAYKAARISAQQFGSLLPPKHILNAPTKLMGAEGYGVGYQYDHDAPDAFSGQDYFPTEMGRQKYYKPVERGFERDIGKRLDYWSKLRRQRGSS